MEVMWKSTTSIVNWRLTAAIHYHDTLHGFRTVCGTGTATLEAKLLQQLMAMRDAVFHTIFLDLQKVYDTLGRYRCLNILAQYSMGPGKLWILQMYWAWLHMVAKAGGYFDPPPLQGLLWGDSG